MVEEQFNSVSFELPENKETTLVHFNSTYSSDWSAEFQGRKLPVIRSNYWSMAFLIPAHEGLVNVKLHYFPTTFYLLLLGPLSWLFFLIRELRRN